jgi:hypothetical protein
MENTANTVAQNPLSKYFRQPAIYMKLPSAGRYWAEGSVELPVTGEIPVYPMTAKDEVTLRTPDALMNGAGVVDVIQSCCPSIKDGWKMPSVDLDATLIGIRIASYGHEMAIDSKCPHCGEENNHALDLRNILGEISCPDYSKKIKAGDLHITVKPQPFFNVNQQNSVSFEEQRLLEAVNKADLSEEDKITRINESMSRLLKISVDNITNSTESIETTDGTVVTDRNFIGEFYNNADGSVIRAIQKRLGEINEEASIRNRKVVCTSCTEQFEIPLEFDYANFFAVGS